MLKRVRGKGRQGKGMEGRGHPWDWEGTSTGEGKMCKLKRTAGERGGRTGL